MAEVILMPRLSDTMTEGVIASWHKNVGDSVKKGELLAEIETDKATMELESYKDGTILHLGGAKGSKIQVNDLLAIIGQQGEDISQHLGGSAPAAAEAPAAQAGGGQPDLSTAVTHASEKVEKSEGDVAVNGADYSRREEVVLMPRLSDTMTEGVIAGWHKKVGDPVKKGDLLADIETDKATMELESYKDGTLLHQGAPAGTKVAVNDLLAIIGDASKVNVEEIVQGLKGGGSAAPAAAPGPQAAAANEQPAAGSPQPAPSENGRVKASPLARKMASEKGIDLRQVQGTGDGGRITRSDIEGFKQPASGTQQPATGSPAAPAAPAPAPAPQAPAGEEGYTDLNVSQMRKAIARRLGESKFSAPHFYLTMEINMDKAMEARTGMNEVSDVKISFNDMVVKAAAMALRRHPAVNSSWMGDTIRQYSHIHVGVAVAIEDGLIVPVVRFADTKPLSRIAAETKELAAKAKGKKLQPAEFTGNTFTISNLGMMDIEEFTAIINPPDSAIMAVGRIKEVVVRKGEGFGVSNFMKVTLSCDHRSVDGAVGAAFLQTFKKFLENPVTMLV